MFIQNTLLPIEEFKQAVATLPLVSIDWVLTNTSHELLVGKRLNAPARGAWFTPGGRIRKGEALPQAMSRVLQDELGVPLALADMLIKRCQLMGAWDHFYPDAAFSTTVPTHYVNLPHWVCLDLEEVAALSLPVGDQHSEWRWISLKEATTQVHHWVQPYVDWVKKRQSY